MCIPFGISYIREITTGKKMPYILVCIVLMLVLLCALSLVTAKRYKTVTLTYSLTLYPKVRCLEQRTKCKTEGYCPKDVFKNEINKIIDALRCGCIYVTSTHQSVINIMKEHPDVASGKVVLTVHPNLSYKTNLAKIKRMLIHKKSKCDSCDEKETCRTYQGSLLKNEIVDSYAVSLRRNKK